MGHNNGSINADTPRVFRVAVATTDLRAFLAACERTGWRARDTGERIATDESPNAESVLALSVSPQARHDAALAAMR